MVAFACHLTTRRLIQEDSKIKDNLDFIERLYNGADDKAKNKWEIQSRRKGGKD